MNKLVCAFMALSLCLSCLADFAFPGFGATSGQYAAAMESFDFSEDAGEVKLYYCCAALKALLDSRPASFSEFVELAGAACEAARADGMPAADLSDVVGKICLFKRVWVRDGYGYVNASYRGYYAAWAHGQLGLTPEERYADLLGTVLADDYAQPVVGSFCEAVYAADLPVAQKKADVGRCLQKYAGLYANESSRARVEEPFRQLRLMVEVLKAIE